MKCRTLHSTLSINFRTDINDFNATIFTNNDCQTKSSDCRAESQKLRGKVNTLTNQVNKEHNNMIANNMVATTIYFILHRRLWQKSRAHGLQQIRWAVQFNSITLLFSNCIYDYDQDILAFDFEMNCMKLFRWAFCKSF